MLTSRRFSLGKIVVFGKGSSRSTFPLKMLGGSPQKNCPSGASREYGELLGSTGLEPRNSLPRVELVLTTGVETRVTLLGARRLQVLSS